LSFLSSFFKNGNMDGEHKPEPGTSAYNPESHYAR
jgi:hypothetical protein